MTSASCGVSDRSGLTVPSWYRNLISEDAKDGTVLEVGCGTGKLTSYLTKVSDLAIGCDISHPRLSIAKERAANILAGSGTDLPIKSQSIDVVICIEVIEHVPKGKRLLKEIHRVLKSDGVLYLKTPNQWTHDAFQLFSGRLRESRDFHPNLYTHQKFVDQVDSLFNVKFMKANPAQYQIEKIKAVSPTIGSMLNKYVDFKNLPLVIQPSIYTRCTLK